MRQDRVLLCRQNLLATNSSVRLVVTWTIHLGHISVFTSGSPYTKPREPQQPQTGQYCDRVDPGEFDPPSVL